MALMPLPRDCFEKGQRTFVDDVKANGKTQN